MDFSRSFDLLVLGGGNAALCAALTARRAGLSVLMLEAAPVQFRGGNSRHTRNIRTMHEAPFEVLADAYPEEEYWEDLVKVTGGMTDERLARMTIRGTVDHLPWMKSHGVRFQPALGGTLHLARTNAFFLGGGKALVNAYYAAAAKLGVEVAYDAEVVDLEMDGGRFVAATVAHGGAGTGCARALWSRRPADSNRTSNGCARRGDPPWTTSSCAARRTTSAAC